MTLISTRDLAHDFSVMFSPSLCVAVVASLTGKMATICQQISGENYLAT